MDGYVYNSAEEPKILMTGKWNESMNYQPCDMEGEPLPGTELKEVLIVLSLLYIFVSQVSSAICATAFFELSYIYIIFMKSILILL